MNIFGKLVVNLSILLAFLVQLILLTGAVFAGIAGMISLNIPILIILAGIIAFIVHILEIRKLKANDGNVLSWIKIVSWIFVTVAAYALYLLILSYSPESYSGGALKIVIVAGIIVSLFLLLVMIVPKTNRDYLRSQLKLLKPLFFLLFPTFVTLALIGAVCALLLMAEFPYSGEKGTEYPHLIVFGAVEGLSFITMVFLWSWIAKVWLRTSWFWPCLILFMMVLTAGYRTHRWEVRNDGFARSGPLIRKNIHWPTTVYPFIGFAVFVYYVSSRPRVREQEAQPGAAANREDRL